MFSFLQTKSVGGAVVTAVKAKSLWTGCCADNHAWLGELPKPLQFLPSHSGPGTFEEASCSKKEGQVLPEMEEGACQVPDDTLRGSRKGMRGGLGGRRGWSSMPAHLGGRWSLPLLIVGSCLD